eukprot:4614078-Prymnesium_polylepis.3
MIFGVSWVSLSETSLAAVGFSTIGSHNFSHTNAPVKSHASYAENWMLAGELSGCKRIACPIGPRESASENCGTSRCGPARPMPMRAPQNHVRGQGNVPCAAMPLAVELQYDEDSTL